MVTSPHEVLHRVFQEDRKLFARAFTQALGVAFPLTNAVSVLNVDLTEIAPIERRVDTALLVETNIGKHVIVVESQTAPEESRRQSWPYYVSFLHNRYSCPVTLVVVTADRKTARWARQPIKIGLLDAPSQITLPLVVGPDNVPAIVDVDQAQGDIMLAVFSALTHRFSAEVGEILIALAAALDRVDVPTAVLLAEFTEIGLGKTPAAKTWRALMSTMTYGFESELHRRWRAEGREEGREEGHLQRASAAVLRVLEARGLVVPESVARRVNECTDLTVLEDLLDRAVTVKRAEDLFTDHIA